MIGMASNKLSTIPDDVAEWDALLAEALRETGGPLSEEEHAWADDVLGQGPSGRSGSRS